jgi:hypothetical protein
MMKTAIVVLLALGAAAAWAGDLNPVGNNVCGAGSINTNPANIEGEAAFDKIYDNLTSMISSGELSQISANDGTWWGSGNLPDKTYAYLMIKFVKPGGYTSGTLHWQIGVDSGAVVSAYRWNKGPTPHEWDFMNSNAGGYNPAWEIPAAKTYAIPSSYFDGNGVLWLLFVGAGGSDVLSADVVDISY